jgi:hypothetical protein
VTTSVDDTTIVVFDVNIYLDVAELLGVPVSWASLQQKMAQVAGCIVPWIEDERVDSLKAISYASRGHVIPGEPLEVWSSDHIDETVFWKATQAPNSGAPEDSGLGWSDADATTLLERLVRDLVYDKTNGGGVEVTKPHSWSAVSHEDGQVYETAYRAGDFEGSPRICVTRDNDFREAAPYLSARVDIMYPWEFVQYLQRASRPPPDRHPAAKAMRRNRGK